jgi:uncharacterized protein YkwD
MPRGPSGGALLLVVPLVVCLASSSTNSGVSPPRPYAPPLSTLERQTHARVNVYRASKRLAALAWSDVIADQARRHSTDMATGATGLGHDGFDTRLAAIAKSVPWSNAGENVGMMTNKTDPAAVVVDLWVDSRSHRKNIEGDFDTTGIGIARTSSGSLYFTQIFVAAK